MTVVRESFDTSFDLRKATLKLSSVCSIEYENISLMYKKFNQFGFVLLDCNSAKDFLEELKALKKYFGQVSTHKRSDIHGVSVIKVIPGFPDYFGTTSEDTGLHTDGACSKEAPNILIFQCEIPAEQGGETQLLSCKLLYQHIQKSYPELLEKLFIPYAFTISRDKEIKTNSVFTYGKNNKIFTIFRANGNAKISVARESQKAFQVVKEFVKDKKNILQFKLKSNQILIIDNTAVMHGRLGFPENSKRKLNRLFLDGNVLLQDTLCLGFEP